MIVERFAQIARRGPQRLAVLGNEHHVTYGELAARAGGVAGLVRESGARPGQRIALLLDHGADAVAGMLGVLSAGCCYVPLDPRYPVARLVAELADADVSLLLTTRTNAQLADRLLGAVAAAGPVRVRHVDDVPPAPLAPRPAPDPAAPAYLLHTSGSTGKPKGVLQTVGNLAHTIEEHVRGLRITQDDRLTLLAPVGSDAAVPDVFSALVTGAALVPVDVARFGVDHLAATLADRRVTVYHSTPTLYRWLLDSLPRDAVLPHLRVVLLGGEQMTRDDIARGRWHTGRECVFVNGYGATEATFVARYQVPADADLDALAVGAAIPVGTALPGYEVLVVGEDGSPAETGEIVVRGRHVAAGYWRDAEGDRLGRIGGVPVLRTGDRGRLLPDGRIVHVGRLDRQVKVRGHRVELGEVEAHLEALPGVLRAGAALRQGSTGAEIVAFVQPAGGLPPQDDVQLRRALARRLPGHAIPAALTVVDALPLTPSGKVDTLALSSRAASTSRPQGGQTRTPTEALVASVWCEVLGVVAVGRADAFFDLGGNSLLLNHVHRRLADLGQPPVPLARLIEHPTVAALAAHLDAVRTGEAEGASGPVSGPLPAVAERVARRRARRARQENRA